MRLWLGPLAICLLAAGSVEAAYAKSGKGLGSDFEAMAKTLSFSPEQNSCVTSEFGELKKKHRKKILFRMGHLDVPSPTDTQKVEALDRVFSGSLGLEVLSVGATKIDKWQPFANGLRSVKLGLAANCSDSFDANISQIFELEDGAN